MLDSAIDASEIIERIKNSILSKKGLISSHDDMTLVSILI